MVVSLEYFVFSPIRLPFLFYLDVIVFHLLYVVNFDIDNDR